MHNKPQKLVKLSDQLKKQQTAWLAAHHGARIQFEPKTGWCLKLEDNIFRGVISPPTRSDFTKGAGKELGTAVRPGKLAAPWSSSALALNVFDFWRGRDIAPLTAALGMDSTFMSLRMEEQVLTGFSSRKANVDVVLDGPVQLAIESKFTEPFQGGAQGSLKDSFSPTYIEKKNSRAKWHGLEHLRELARCIFYSEREFRRLDVPQLIKHAVALTNERRRFALLLLWYCPDDDVREVHEMEREIDVLREAMTADGVSFRSMTYQQLFAGLRAQGAADRDCAAYLGYLGDRYFPGERNG